MKQGGIGAPATAPGRQRRGLGDALAIAQRLQAQSGFLAGDGAGGDRRDDAVDLTARRLSR
jgi:hypothetical protein